MFKVIPNHKLQRKSNQINMAPKWHKFIQRWDLLSGEPPKVGTVCVNWEKLKQQNLSLQCFPPGFALLAAGRLCLGPFPLLFAPDPHISTAPGAGAAQQCGLGWGKEWKKCCMNPFSNNAIIRRRKALKTQQRPWSESPIHSCVGKTELSKGENTMPCRISTSLISVVCSRPLWPQKGSNI